MNEQNIPQSNEPIQSSKHIWITIIAVVVTAIIIGAGVYTWQKSSLRATEQSLQQQITQLQNQISQLQQTQPNSNQQTANDTVQQNDDQATNISSDWQTYQNKKYGFELRHPKFISFISEKEEQFGENLRVSLMIDGGEEWQNRPFSLLAVFIWTKDEYSELLKNPVSYSSSALTSGISNAVEKDGKVYELMFGSQDSPTRWANFVQTEDYKKILSSFKLTN